jgi:PhzF family phenazine biosynthesis protein
MKCKLVDVFAKEKLSGNGLTIFYETDDLTTKQMQSLTQEMRQFESIFLSIENGKFYARIFTVEEELDFAGHPLIGLAAHLHEEYGVNSSHDWNVELNNQTVALKTRKSGDYFEAIMEQGKPEFIKVLNENESEVFLSALNLTWENVSGFPLEVISTGLPYLIVPIHSGIDSVKVCVENLEDLLSIHGAKFVYILDTQKFEGRTWDNLGKVEDIATGSAAGPVGAFLYKNDLVTGNQSIVIKQGRFLGRPSEIKVSLKVQGSDLCNILVSGQVCKIANIEFV